ncbi:UNVERIFIED_CONTAM: hypothetical protein FKN15_051628, partial [Acipenser sinensis]
YPSGRIAVFQSYSGLPCGGFYTNVFSDSSDPYTLATFTPFGHASVCHPGSHTVALLLDQDGGILTDEEGTVMKEWNWAQGVKLNETVLIQKHSLSDLILGISSPDISKMSSTPQRTILKCKTKSAASPSLVPIDMEWKETEAVQPQSNNPEASPFRFLSVPARNILWDPPRSSQSSRVTAQFSSILPPILILILSKGLLLHAGEGIRSGRCLSS